jgi:signal transduction histidine kinase
MQSIKSDKNTIDGYSINDNQQIIPLNASINNKTDRKKRLSEAITFTIITKPGERLLLLFHTINRGELFYFPAKLYKGDYFDKFSAQKNNFFGIFQGIFIFIIFFNLIIYAATREEIYLFYLLYALLIGLFALNEVGSLTHLFGSSSFINYISGITFLFLGFAAWLLLMRNFLGVKKSNTRINQLTQSLVLIDLFFSTITYTDLFFKDGFAPAFQKLYQGGITALFAANLLFIISINIIRIRQNDKLPIFYALANIPVIGGTLIYYTNYYNLTNIQFGWSNPIALGLCVETFLLSLGFLFRYNLIIKDKQNLLLSINKHQQEMTKQIIITQETERQRIAEDLHDELGGNLAALKMTLQDAEIPQQQSDKLMALIDKTSENSRNISHNLMPPEFSKTGLKELLENHYKQITQSSSIHFDFICSGDHNPFNKQDELMIYRILMELTNNILKHSNATEATIQMIYYPYQLELMAEDNGNGIKQENFTDGIGLKNISSRVKFLNGDITIDTGDRGTTIIIQIPYNPSSN